MGQQATKVGNNIQLAQLNIAYNAGFNVAPVYLFGDISLYKIYK